MSQIAAHDHQPTQSNIAEKGDTEPIKPNPYQSLHKSQAAIPEYQSLTVYESIDTVDEIKHTYLPFDTSIKTSSPTDNSSRIHAEGM